MADSPDKEMVISELAEALRATLPLITMAVNNKRATERFRTKSRQLRIQSLMALMNAKPFWIPKALTEKEGPDDG
jgi:hypothetical protein